MQLSVSAAGCSDWESSWMVSRYGKGDFVVPVFPDKRLWSAFQSAAVSSWVVRVSVGWILSSFTAHLWFSAHHPHVPLANWILSSFTGASEEQPLTFVGCILGSLMECVPLFGLPCAPHTGTRLSSHSPWRRLRAPWCSTAVIFLHKRRQRWYN